MRRSLILGLCILAGCNKSKIPNSLPLVPVQNAPASSLRLFNFYGGPLDIRINNIQLTSFDSTGQGLGTAAPGGVTYFPGNVWTDASGNGAPFTIPTTLLDKNGQAHLIIKSRPFAHNYNNYYPFRTIDTVLRNDPAHPTDFYVEWTGHIQRLPRSTAAPASPYDIKVRVVNFSSVSDTFGLTGKATLTYADGTPVSPVTSNIDTGSESPYVELPFGAYQFKVFMNGDFGKQLSGPGSGPIWSCGLPEPAQEAIFPNIATFRPGYTYSIFVTPAIEDLICDNADNYIGVNTYKILADNTTSPNTTFALLQAVNALPSGPVQFKIDGAPVGGAMAFTQYTTDFHPVVMGTHTIQVYDASGALLVEKPYTFYSYDYLTAWVYEKDGKPDVVFSANDMTSSVYLPVPNNGVPDDGTDGSKHVESFPGAWQCRFLNLSEDLPYATFTNDLVTFGDYLASVNLAPGQVADTDWEVIGQLSSNAQNTVSLGTVPTAIRVNASSPGPPAVIPGTLLYGIRAVYPQDFIANPAMYDPGLAPPTEPGVYTVALVGNTAAADATKAKMIIVKHFK